MKFKRLKKVYSRAPRKVWVVILLLVGGVLASASIVQAIWMQVFVSSSERVAIETTASPSPESSPATVFASPLPSPKVSSKPATQPVSPKPSPVTTETDLKLEWVGTGQFSKSDKQIEWPNPEGLLSFQNYTQQPFRIYIGHMKDPASHGYVNDIAATVKNDGPEPVFNVEYEVRSNGVTVGKVIKDRIDQGTKATLRIATIDQSTPGDIPYQVIINGSKTIPEKDYSNNSFSFTFVIDPRQGP